MTIKPYFDYTLDPVDKTAKKVTSQDGCTDTVYMTSAEEVLPILDKLQKRQKELREILGIKTRSQLKNRKYYRKYPVCIKCNNKMKIQTYNINNEEAFQELLLNGHKIQEFTQIYIKLKKLGKKPNRHKKMRWS